MEKLLKTDGAGAQTFEVASGHSASVLEVAEMVADGFERAEGIRPEVKVVENPRPAEALVDSFDVDATHAREVLGWEAEISLEDGIAEMIEAGV